MREQNQGALVEQNLGSPVEQFRGASEKWKRSDFGVRKWGASSNGI